MDFGMSRIGEEIQTAPILAPKQSLRQ